MHTEFIKDLCKKITMPVYLETNGTLLEELGEVIDYITYIAADIKLPSSSGVAPLWDKHEKFFEIASQKELFAKVVFDARINDFEIHKITHLCKKNNVELILQPKMTGNNIGVTPEDIRKVLDKCLQIYPKTRLIPQTHKFINVL